MWNACGLGARLFFVYGFGVRNKNQSFDLESNIRKKKKPRHRTQNSKLDVGIKHALTVADNHSHYFCMDPLCVGSNDDSSCRSCIVLKVCFQRVPAGRAPMAVEPAPWPFPAEMKQCPQVLTLKGNTTPHPTTTSPPDIKLR